MVTFHQPKKQLFDKSKHNWIEDWDIRQQDTIVKLNHTTCPRETTDLMRELKELKDEYLGQLMSYADHMDNNKEEFGIA